MAARSLNRVYKNLEQILPKAHLDGVDLHYEVMGQGDWLVMIGGYVSGNHDAWGLQPQKLAESFKVLVFDNRGIGESSAPDIPYTTRMMANDTLMLMKHLDIERAHIFGKSLGGAIAQWMAIDAPEAVRSIAMTSSFGCSSLRMKKMVQWWLDSAQSHGGLTSEVISGLLTYFFTESYWEENAGALQKSVANILSVHRPVRGFLNTGNCLLTHDTMAQLGKIICPVQVLVGADDIITTAEHNREIARRIPGAELQIIPNSLHGFMTEVPASFQLIEEFFKKH